MNTSLTRISENGVTAEIEAGDSNNDVVPKIRHNTNTQYNRLPNCISVLLNLFVQDDQTTAAVSIADVPRLRGGTDVDLLLFVYFSRGTSGSEYTVKRLVAIFQRRKSEILLKNIIKKIIIIISCV